MQHQGHKKTIVKKIPDIIRATQVAEEEESYVTKLLKGKKISKVDREQLIKNLEVEMKEAAKALDFERAADLRDTIFELKAEG